MKNIITFIILLGTVTANAQKTLKTDSVYITGKVSNVDASKPNGNTIILIINDLASNKQPNYSATIKADGTYRLTFLKIGTQDVMFKYGDRLVILLVTPGDHLQLDYDAHNFQTSLIFSGDDAQTNRDYVAYQKALNNDAGVGYNGDYNVRSITRSASEKDSEPDAHKKFLTDRYTKESVFFNNYLKAHQLSPVFIKWAKANLRYEYLENLMRYTWLHAAFNHKKMEDFVLPDSYYDFIDKNDLNNINGAVCSSFGSYIGEYNRYFINKNLGKSFNIKDEFALILKQPAGIMRNLMLSYYMYDFIDNGAVNWAKTYMAKFKANEGEQALRNSVQNAYDRIYSYTLPPSTKLNNLPKAVGDSLFNKITAKYPGKVVYIDFWATWCLPCRAEMPYSKNLHQQLAGKDVVFVYLGVKSDEKLWRSLIAELGIEGEHFFLNDHDFTAISEKFQISGVPHYILIDKKGRIVNDNAKRPSDEQLKPEIEKLLATK
jgi:thiol-disulfide isomerase/thioredoxin